MDRTSGRMLPADQASGPPVAGPLLRKLNRLGLLSAKATSALEAMTATPYWAVADQDLFRQGDRPPDCKLILQGLVCRYKVLDDGRRQIVSFHVPGDIVDLNSLLLGALDHSISTLTAVRLVSIKHATLLDWMRQHSDFGRLLWLDTLIDASIFREWVVNVGRRTARERIAHLLCELVVRLRAAGLAQDRAFDLRITQAELADATGLSPVHVNRTVQELRRDGLIEMNNKTLITLDWEALKQTAGFDPAYLHQLAASA